MEVHKSTPLKRFRITGMFRTAQKEKHLILLSIPGVMIVFVFSYIPIAGLLMAFQRYQLGDVIILGSEWIGLKHFYDFINGPYFYRVMRNTILLNLYSLLFGFPAPILLALLFDEIRSKIFKSVVQTISYLPHFITIVVIVGLMKIILGLDGVVNSTLGYMGMQSINFFNEPSWFRTLYVTSGIWQSVGFSTILYLAVLTTVNQEVVEAATVDGANRFQRVLYLKIPILIPLITLLLILNIGHLVSSGFEKVYLMYNPLTYETADVIATYVYRRGIEGAQYSFATAVGLFNSIINFILLMFANRLANKTNQTSLY